MKVQLDNFLLILREDLPRTVANARSEQRGTKVFGWKGAPRKAKNVGDVELDEGEEC
jgi:hypothetical protein